MIFDWRLTIYPWLFSTHYWSVDLHYKSKHFSTLQPIVDENYCFVSLRLRSINVLFQWIWKVEFKHIGDDSQYRDSNAICTFLNARWQEKFENKQFKQTTFFSNVSGNLVFSYQFFSVPLFLITHYHLISLTPSNNFLK